MQLIFSVIFTVIIILTGCSGGQGVKQQMPETESSRQTSRIITEHGRGQEKAFAMSERDTGILHLEAPDADMASHPGNDTGDRGMDSVTLQIDSAGEKTFCFKDDDGESHRMILKDSGGSEVTNVTAEGVCSSIVLKTGAYQMEVYHGGEVNDGKADTVFIRPEDPDSLLLKSLLSGSSKGSTKRTPASVMLLSVNSCAGCDLKTANLKNASLMGANLRNANLRDANLSGADLRNAYLQKADLSGARLAESVMENANLRHAYLAGANLARAKASQANFGYTDLSGANLGSAILNKTFFTESILSGADLQASDLSDADMRFADMTSANLTGANLSAAHLYKADFSNANLRNADFANANISFADFSGADTGSTNLEDASRGDEPKKGKPQ